jgi:hypothetical protein
MPLSGLVFDATGSMADKLSLPEMPTAFLKTSNPRDGTSG